MGQDGFVNSIDAHVHIWTDDFHKYPLASGFVKESIEPAAYPPGKILSDAQANGVNRIVLVQMNFYGFDNSYMLEAIRQFPSVFRGIAVVDSRRKDLTTELGRLSKLGIRGYRLYPDELSPARIAEDGFTGMFRFAEREQASLCLLINPEALKTVDRQCQRFPGAPIVIDHLARIGMGGPIEEEDIRSLCALAKHPQVRVKLSGFYALGAGRPPHSDLLSFIRRAYDAFGANRLMWGSDCPFLTMHEAYADSIAVVRDRMEFLSAEDKEWILRRTAEELFFGPITE